MPRGLKFFLWSEMVVVVVSILFNKISVVIIGTLLMFLFFIIRLFYRALHSPSSNTPQAGSSHPAAASRRGPSQSSQTAVTRAPIAPMTSSTISAHTQKAVAIEKIARWIPPGEVLSFQECKIAGGMIYFGEALPSITSGRGIEPALIAPELPVNFQAPDLAGAGLSYWPSYAAISAEARGAYLLWLSGGRNFPSIAIGYVFLFFYGLERRVLYDYTAGTATKEEALQIVEEVKRLLEVYGENASFSGYARRFVEITSLILGIGNACEIKPDETAEFGLYSPSFLLYMKQWLKSNKFIGPRQALAWYFHDPETRCSIRKPARNCPEQFRQLFEIRFERQFPEGLSIAPAWKSVDCLYRPASASFGGQVRIALGEVPSLANQNSKREKIRSIAEACCDELSTLSRWISKNPTKMNSEEALTLLPTELLSADASPVAANLRADLESLLVDEGMALIPGEMLLNTAGIVFQGKLSKAESTHVIQFLEKLSYGVEPDVRFGGPTINTTGTCVLFRLAEGAPKSASPSYAATQNMLQLAGIVVHADDAVNPSEEEALTAFIRGQHGLTEPEQARLSAHLKWVLQEPPRFEKLRKRLSSLVAEGSISIEARRALGGFVVAVAGADAVFTVDEMKTLTKIFESLGLDVQEAYALVNSCSAGTPPRTDDPTPIILTSSSGPSFKVPAPRNNPPKMALDEASIQRKMTETAAVAALLNDIFEEGLPLAAPVALSPAIASIWGLDASHSTLLMNMSRTSSWTREQFESLVIPLNLLPDGALDRINEAAIETCGLPVCEGEDVVLMNLELLKGVCL